MRRSIKHELEITCKISYAITLVVVRKASALDLNSILKLYLPAPLLQCQVRPFLQNIFGANFTNRLTGKLGSSIRSSRLVKYSASIRDISSHKHVNRNRSYAKAFGYLPVSVAILIQLNVPYPSKPHLNDFLSLFHGHLLLPIILFYHPNPGFRPYFLLLHYPFDITQSI